MQVELSAVFHMHMPALPCLRACACLHAMQAGLNLWWQWL
jgi:hypothetical protein